MSASFEFEPTHRGGNNVNNVYVEASTDSPLDTQVVMGEEVQVLDASGEFSRIRTGDGYGGWIRSVRLVPMSALPREVPEGRVISLLAPVLTEPKVEGRVITVLPIDARVGLTEQVVAGTAFNPSYQGVVLPDGQRGFVLSAQVEPVRVLLGDRTLAMSHKAAQAACAALRFIGTPYLWGGTTPFGIDCSGLIQASYRRTGLLLPRNADMQFDDSRFSPILPDVPLADCRFVPGDLLAFGKTAKNITHIGIATGEAVFVHSSGHSRRGGTYEEPISNTEYHGIYRGARRIRA